jgi:hypothetical protein
MWNKEQKDIWRDIKNIWNNQPQSEKINIQVSKLIVDFKSKISQFEKDSINKDIAMLKRSVSQFEKKSILRDINIITSFIKKVIDKFRMKS